jgi:Ca-activated chloride channel family protein
MSEITSIYHSRFAGIPADGPFQVDLLVRIQAPDAPEALAAPRMPLHLAVVLDRSGSMSGGPLREACRCAAAILDRMGPQDRLALVAYDNRARVLRPCTPLNDKEETRRMLTVLDTGGNTNLHLGWATGIQELRKAHQPGVISRVLLLSDGQANAGMVDPDSLAHECAEAQTAGISTSTYGLGRDFGEGVMTTMAKHGQGRSYYGESSEDLMDPFMEEFDLLSNLVARKLTLTLKALPGIRVIQRNGYLPNGEGSWNLPDLPYQGEAWALFRLEGQASDLTPWVVDGKVALAQIGIHWQDKDVKEVFLPHYHFHLPILPSTAYSLLTEDPLVARRVGELAVTDLQEQAHQAALIGDWERVQVLLDELKRHALDNPWTTSVVEELETLMAEGQRDVLLKELRFSSSMGSMRLTEKEECADFSAPTSSYLRRKPRQGKSKKPNTDPEP